MYARHFIFLPIFSLSVSENVQRLGEDETLSRFDAMPYLSSFFIFYFPFFSAFSRYKASSCLSHSCTFFNTCLPSRQVHISRVMVLSKNVEPALP